MPQLNFLRAVPYDASDMMELVADVTAYPEFVPNCTHMEITRDAETPNLLLNARMHIRFGPYNGAYTSRVEIDPDEKTIRAEALDGPFSHLDSKWTFENKDGGTEVRFEIDFAFANPLLATVAEPAFAAKQEEIMDAFMAEAKEKLG